MSRANFVLTPAYGRDYKSKAEVLADFNADKDFQVHGPTPSGAYTNRADLNRLGLTEVNVRWKRMTMVGVLRCKNGKWSLA